MSQPATKTKSAAAKQVKPQSKHWGGARRLPGGPAGYPGAACSQYIFRGK